ncbi:MAG: phage protein [Burkholderiaceae bacterium]|nr:phage protein [Burkholderiaceae bacterium]
MEALNTVPEPKFELSYNGKNITADISPYVASVTYIDHLEGEADSIDIDLEDSDGRWLDAWYPEKGASLAYKFGYAHQKLASAGSFDLDELEITGTTSAVRIKALSAGVQKAVRTRRGKAYEKTTLAAIAQRIAKRNKMKLSGKIDRIQIDRVTQYQESDLAFLHRLAGQYGYAFKVTDNNKKMVFWKSTDLLGQKPIRTYTPNDLLPGWRIRDKVSDVPNAVVMKHHNRRTRKTVSAKVTAERAASAGTSGTGATSSADTVKINRRVTSKANAEVQAQAELDRRHLDRTSGEIIVTGDQALAAGVNIELKGFGKLSGIYTIHRATHTHRRHGGYTSMMEIKRSAPAANQK